VGLGVLGPFLIQPPRQRREHLGFEDSRTPVGLSGNCDPQNLTDLINGVVLLAQLEIRSRAADFLGWDEAVRGERKKVG